VTGIGDECQPYDAAIRRVQVPGADNDPSGEQPYQKGAADQTALHVDAKVFVVCGPGVQLLDDRAVRRDHRVAGADPPPEPGGQGGGVLETRPQQASSAQVGGLIFDDVEQPDVRQIPREGNARISSSRSRAGKTVERIDDRLSAVTATA
jgi:hypothetical protein